MFTTKRAVSIFLLFSLVLFVLIYPVTAHAYIIRSSGSGTAYGMARSTPSSSTISWIPSRPSPPSPPPPPAPEPPSSPSPQLPQLPVDPAGLNAQELLLLQLVNNQRARAGIAPLRVDARLVALARLKSQDMITHRYFAHESPVYGRSGDMLRSAGYRFALAAENIGMGGNISSIFSAFMSSPSHRSKIMDARYTHTGIGVKYDPRRGYLVSQFFVQPR